MFKTRFKKLALLFLSLFLATGAFLHFIAPRVITQIDLPVLSWLTPNYFSDQTFPSSPDGNTFFFKGHEDISLNTHITFSKRKNSKGTIILIHGIRSQKETFIDLSAKLSNAGYNAVALDLRAHGLSKGSHCTFGVKEKEDISCLLNTLESMYGIKDNIGIWGQSLGGAVALQSLANDNRIKFGIIESTFSNFEDIAHEYFALNLGFDPSPLSDYLIYRAGKIADFDPKQSAPTVACQNITQPILIVHGDADARINIRHGKQNFKHLKSIDKEILIVEGGTHTNIWASSNSTYFEKVFSFIDNSIEIK